MQVSNDIPTLKECTVEIIDWLHEVFVLMESGQKLQPNPFYERTALFEEQKVIDGIQALENIFISELKKYPGYHRNAQGISTDEYLVPPGFDKLSYPEKLAIMQGIDKICLKYRDLKINKPATEVTYDEHTGREEDPVITVNGEPVTANATSASGDTTVTLQVNRPE